MAGELVIIRDFRGRPLVRRVWMSDQRGVYITDDEGFASLKAGKRDHIPVGFPREDVFEYDPELAVRAQDLYASGAWDWGRLRRWRQSGSHTSQSRHDTH